MFYFLVRLQILEDDMLGVEPLELQFEFNNMMQILSCSIELTNDTDSFIAFKIQKNSQLPYSIQPEKNIVKPRSKYVVGITLPEDYEEALQYSTRKRHFTVQSTKVNESLTASNITQSLFDEYATRNKVDDIYLEVVPHEPSSKEVFFSSTFSRQYLANSWGLSIDGLQFCNRLH